LRLSPTADDREPPVTGIGIADLSGLEPPVGPPAPAPVNRAALRRAPSRESPPTAAVDASENWRAIAHEGRAPCRTAGSHILWAFARIESPWWPGVPGGKIFAEYDIPAPDPLGRLLSRPVITTAPSFPLSPTFQNGSTFAAEHAAPCEFSPLEFWRLSDVSGGALPGSRYFGEIVAICLKFPRERESEPSAPISSLPRSVMPARALASWILERLVDQVAQHLEA